MTKPLVQNSTLSCPHGGRATPALKSPARLTVSAQQVLTAQDVEGATVAGCTISPTPSTAPCTAVSTVTAGTASKLTVGGRPVLLDSLQAVLVGSPGGSLSADAVQTKLTAQ